MVFTLTDVVTHRQPVNERPIHSAGRFLVEFLDGCLVAKCFIGAIHPTGHSLHAGTEVLCRAQLQGAEADTGDGPVPDTQMATVAPPNCTEHDGWVLYTQRKTVEPRRVAHPVGKGHYGFPFLQVLQRNDRRTVAPAAKGTPL